MKIKKKRDYKNIILTTIALLLLLIGGYSLYNIFSPMIQSQMIDPKNNSTVKKLIKTSEEKITENRLYIPKIDINLPYSQGDASVMEKGAWWRQPQNGNPADGGNFILSAHRFIMGLTPEKTLKKSPFYNIGRLENGDQIIIDYDGKRYVYEITKKFSVKPDSIEIEKRTKEPQMTLYSCTFGGSSDGRDVFIAKLKASDAQVEIKK